MPRIAAGLAGLALITLTACGTSPGTTPPPAPTPVPTATAEATAEATADTTATPGGTATATPNGTASASPNGTASATPGGTASATPGAGGSAQAVDLPTRVESFNRVEQRSENDVRIGSYYSDPLKTVVEARMARGKSATEMLTSVGASNPSSVSGAMCSAAGDSVCAREANGVVVVVSAKELPTSMVADLTAKFLDA